MTEKRGLTYPLQANNGTLLLSQDFGLVREHILSVIETRPYERVLNADYGLSDLVFETIDPDLINARIAKAIYEEVEEVSDVEVLGNTAGADNGVYSVTIRYRVNGLPQAPINFQLLR